MKRSEMIELIEKYIKEGVVTDVHSKDIAFDILNLIEDAGMLPPCHNIIENIGGCGCEIYYKSCVNEWEPEDD